MTAEPSQLGFVVLTWLIPAYLCGCVLLLACVAVLWRR